jgi:hypothetical protein
VKLQQKGDAVGEVESPNEGRVATGSFECTIDGEARRSQELTGPALGETFSFLVQLYGLLASRGRDHLECVIGPHKVHHLLINILRIQETDESVGRD